MPVLIKYNQIFGFKKHSSHLAQTSRHLGWQTEPGMTGSLFLFGFQFHNAELWFQFLSFLCYNDWGLLDSGLPRSSSRAPAELLISCLRGPCNPVADQGWSHHEMPSLCSLQPMNSLFSVNSSITIPTLCAVTWTANVSRERRWGGLGAPLIVEFNLILSLLEKWLIS